MQRGELVIIYLKYDIKIQLTTKISKNVENKTFEICATYRHKF